eukprot:CAMPEP_0115515010 /NCGR_PEP_ID=MMETSP0271-20121206/75975_1 /TAXON_ID=71861 /ORGANISM="Scrippsiella trochoidea, Strain CCMP3099" /LENGTH=921 /DNA_ID=CAMNT_0002945527 /DNA_START=150 /DNA_END=2912 /DNA_ORIENTATION=+
MTSIGLSSVQPSDHADVTQALHVLWQELGSEVLLLALFCAGFALFRQTAVRELIPGGTIARKGSKTCSKACTFKDVAPTPPLVSPKVGPGAASKASPTAPRSPEASPTLLQPSARRSVSMSTLSASSLHCGGVGGSGSGGSPASMAGSAFPRPLSPAWGFSPSASTTASAAGRTPLATPSAGDATAAAALERVAKTGDLDLLREVCQQAAAEGDALPFASCEALLRASASSGEGSAVEVFDLLITGMFEPSEPALTAVVSLCAESRHVRLAERAVAYARKAYGRSTLALYSALMKVYGHARLWHKTCDLFDDMRRDGVEPDTAAYGSLIKAAVESGRHELAQQLFKESGNPDLLNYMSLIRAAGREHNVPKALRLLDELESSPLAADATAYNCALEACAACNDRAAADELFKRIVRLGHVDVVSYNTYLKVLLANGAHSQINAVLKEMSARGLPPNVVTYNSMVKDAVARGDTQRAWRLTDAMEKAGVMPDAFTCSILMKFVKQNPNSEDIDRIVDLVRRANVRPDEVLVNCLLDACVRLRDPQRITHVLEHFKATGVVPSPHAYSMLIRAYGHARRVDRAKELWRELTSGSGSTQHEEAFAAMVEACLAGGDLRGALAVFREAGEELRRFPRAPSTFAACVKACIQHKQPRLAIELYNDTKDLFICGRVAYNSLIDAIVRLGDLPRAGELFRDMTLKNVMPDLITYSTLIKGHCSRGDLEQGLQLLGLMQRRGIQPDAVLFNSILDGCAHKQMRTLTEQVLRDMEAAGIAPSNFTLSILTKLYGRCGDLEAAFHAVEFYPEKYMFEINAQVFTCLMSACIANGELPRAVEVYDSMVDAGCAPDAKTYQTLLSGCVRIGDPNFVDRLLRDCLDRGLAMRLDGEAIDASLLLIARRGSPDLAAPLAEDLRAAGASVSQRALA